MFRLRGAFLLLIFSEPKVPQCIVWSLAYIKAHNRSILSVQCPIWSGFGVSGFGLKSRIFRLCLGYQKVVRFYRILYFKIYCGTMDGANLGVLSRSKFVGYN